MSTEQSRAAFEKWWTHKRRGFTVVNADIQMELQWAAWQGSRSELSVELPDKFEVEMGAYGTAEVISVTEAKAALRAAGITVRDE